MNPAEELRAAATKLREMAAAATQGPWQACAPWSTGGEAPEEVQTVTTAGYPNFDVAGWAVDTDDVGFQGGVKPWDAAWIALMGPDKAALLADWLESSAKTTEAMLATWQRNPLELTDPHALALARSILVETR